MCWIYSTYHLKLWLSLLADDLWNRVFFCDFPLQTQTDQKTKKHLETCKAKNHIFIPLLNSDWFYCSFRIGAGNQLKDTSMEKRWCHVFYTRRKCFSRTDDSGEKKQEVSEVELCREMGSGRLSFQTCCFCLIKIVHVQSVKDSGNVNGSSLSFIIQDMWNIDQNYFVETLRSSWFAQISTLKFSMAGWFCRGAYEICILMLKSQVCAPHG